MKKPSKMIPVFDSEDQERKFWSKKDSTPYVEYHRVVGRAFPGLKPTRRLISIRLPESLLQNIKIIATRADVPYQSLMKMMLDEKVAELLRRKKKRRRVA